MLQIYWDVSQEKGILCVKERLYISPILVINAGWETQQITKGTQLSRLYGSKHFIEKIPTSADKKRLKRKCKTADRGRKESRKPVRRDTT